MVAFDDIKFISFVDGMKSEQSRIRATKFWKKRKAIKNKHIKYDFILSNNNSASKWLLV